MVRDAIANAAQRTGVDFDFLMAQARLESGLDPQARAATSSATGLYQFVNSTWLDTLDKHGERHGLGWASAAIERVSGRAVASDRATLPALLALRNDPQIAAVMAGELANDNAAALRPVLGRDPDASELYLAHFMGAAGAGRFLTSLASDPGQSAAALFPAAAAANRSIFSEGARPRSLGEVMQLMRDKVAGAMGARDSGELTPTSWASAALGRGARPLTGGDPSAAGPQSGAGLPSMAATLRATFGDSGERSPAAARVNAAYAKIAAFGF